MDYQAKTDWTYNDTVTEQDMNRIEAGLGDLHQRLDTPATSELVLQPGTQTVQVARDTPFHLTGISGRMLLNLLGRNGNCESLNGWTFTGTGTLNTSQFVAGTASIQITASASGAIMSRNVELKAGKTYVLAASIKLGTATGAMVSITGITNGSVVTSSGNFTTSYMRFTATASTHTVAVVLQATQGQTAYVDAIRLYEVSAAEYSQLGSMTASKVDQTYPYTEGLAGVKNPYAIRWASAAKTDVAAMLALDTELLAPPVPADDAERDRLEQGVDGQYYKTSSWRKVALTGEMSWVVRSSSTGIKRVQLTELGQSVATIPQGYMTKYDGKVLNNDLGAIANWTTGDIWQLGDPSYNNLIISIAGVDSGWGDNYTPTANELKAYFYGWVMGTQSSNGTFTIGYNGTGTKAWRGLVNDTGSGTVDLPKTYFQDQYSQPDWKPYELVYKRASIITEPVPSEGSVSLVKGENIIEVGSGLILRETAKPVSSDGINYYINARATFASSALTYNSIRPLLIYRNGLLDTTWGQNNGGDNSGSRQAGLGGGGFDKTAAYTVTYFARSTFPAMHFTGSYSKTEQAIFNNLIRDVQQVTRRVSVVELKKTEKDSGIDWIYPTLINGWSSGIDNTRTLVRYAKVGNFVLVQGELRGGTLGSPAFKLMDGFRPNKLLITIQRGYTGSAVTYCSVTIGQDGFVSVIDGTNNEIDIPGIIFIPE